MANASASSSANGRPTYERTCCGWRRSERRVSARAAKTSAAPATDGSTRDLAPAASQGAFDGATGPAAFLSLNNSDHITLIEEPERVYPAVAAWFRYQLLGDQGGRAYFVGDDCELCNHEQDWVFLQKNLE